MLAAVVGPIGPFEALIVLFFALCITLLFMWLFYVWGAAIAEGKGHPRTLGLFAAFFGPLAIIVLALLPSEASAGSPLEAPGKQPIADELEKLAALRDRGALTDEEFERGKRALLE
jgi:hypothetical protein